LAVQVPRCENSAADAAANWALDKGSFLEVRLPEVCSFIHHLACTSEDMGITFSFDGASRGNPGPSASGVCAWWGHWNALGFQSGGLLLQRGIKLGIGTNNSAEAHGQATTFKTALHLLFWSVDQLMQLTPATTNVQGDADRE